MFFFVCCSIAQHIGATSSLQSLFQDIKDNPEAPIITGGILYSSLIVYNCYAFNSYYQKAKKFTGWQLTTIIQLGTSKVVKQVQPVCKKMFKHTTPWHLHWKTWLMPGWLRYTLHDKDERQEFA